MTGVVLQPVAPPTPQPDVPLRNLALGLGLAIVTAGGAWYQRRRTRLHQKT